MVLHCTVAEVVMMIMNDNDDDEDDYCSLELLRIIFTTWHQHFSLFVHNIYLGVEAVYCLSVNDKFVMKAWGAATKDCAAKGIKLVADGNGEVAEAMGLSKDYSLYGMGKRSVRFAAIVVDGVISNLGVDDGPLLNSSAEHVLTLL